MLGQDNKDSFLYIWLTITLPLIFIIQFGYVRVHMSLWSLDWFTPFAQMR